MTHSAAPRPRFRPALEALEERWLPSARGHHPHPPARHAHHGHAAVAALPPAPVLVLVPGPAGPQGPAGAPGAAGPSGTLIPFDLAAGASSGPIAIPADQPVLLIANTTTGGDQGTGSISLEYTPANGGFLAWSGVNSPDSNGGAGTTTGYSSSAGTHTSSGAAVALTFDMNGQVQLRVVDPNHLVIYNQGSAPWGTQTGSVWMLPAPG